MHPAVLVALASSPEEPRVEHLRTPEGIGYAVGGLLPAWEACLEDAGDVDLVVRFEIASDGAVAGVNAGEGELGACLAAPVAGLRFVEGRLPQPVEVPVRARVAAATGSDPPEEAAPVPDAPP